ncbi:MAG: pyridoxal phosphate-dependent aminotransferase [Nitrospirota bacterium]
MRLTDRVSNIKPSPTLAIAARAKAMKDKGIDVIALGAGEPDFDTPDEVKEAAIDAIRDGFTKYTTSSGIEELRTAIANKLRDENGLSYDKEEIIVSCGAKHSLYNIAQVLFEDGDEVIIPAPYWVSYPAQIILNDAAPVIVNTEERDRFCLSKELLEAHITEKTKAVIINTPSNPTGSSYNKRDLEDIGEVILRHGIYVISDEIYEKIIYDGFKHISIASLSPELKEKTIVVNGLSKSHSMTGWRIGYAAGHRDIIKAMGVVQSQSTSNPTSIAQKAAVAALTSSNGFVREMVTEFDKRRRYIVERLNRINGISCMMPTGAFYAFPNISGLFDNKQIRGSTEFADYLLEEAKVAVVAGSAFGADNYIRLSYAASMENIKEAMDRIEQALRLRINILPSQIF